jgi:hypothetical protein
MHHHPLLFRLWHAYAHCLKRTFAVLQDVRATLKSPG